MIKHEIVPPPEHLFPPDEWRIVEARWSPRYVDRAETVFALANGYLGVRGTLEEGHPALAPATFVSGFHEIWPIVYAEEAHGLARIGQAIAKVPDATVLELFVDDEPLFLPTARMQDYARVLDMRAGTLRRDLTWSTASGKHVTVRSCRLVSLEHRHLVAISYEVVVDLPAPVSIVSHVDNHLDGNDHCEKPDHPDEPRAPDPRLGRRFDDRVLQGRLASHDDGRILLGYETTNSHMTLAVGIDHIVDTPTPYRLETELAADHSQVVLTAEAQPGIPIRIVKYVTYQTSRRATPSELAARCGRSLDRVVAKGFDVLLDDQRRNLDRFWDRADVVVVDRRQPVRIQQAVRWNLFQLAQASSSIRAASISARVPKLRPQTASAISPFTLATAAVTPAPPKRAGSPSRSSTASRVPVDAPEGTPASPEARPAITAVTARVGRDRESRISRACNTSRRFFGGSGRARATSSASTPSWRMINPCVGDGADQA